MVDYGGKQLGSDASTKLKFSVWRDFVPTKALLRYKIDSSEQLSAESELQQEVFSWQTREDPFGGISDDEVRSKLHALLIDRFHPSLAPTDRRFSSMAEFLAEAHKVIGTNGSEWTVSQDAPSDDEEHPYRLNPLLSLTLQLEWLMASFGDLPGVSVSIR